MSGCIRCGVIMIISFLFVWLYFRLWKKVLRMGMLFNSGILFICELIDWFIRLFMMKVLLFFNFIVVLV